MKTGNKERREGISVEGTKERIRYYLEWVRLLWAGTLLNTSGIVGLALALDGRMKVGLLIGGLLLEGIFMILITLAHRRINALITALEEAP